jgi:hypothetical protein
MRCAPPRKLNRTNPLSKGRPRAALRLSAAITIVTVVVLVVLAGCGDGGNETTETGVSTASNAEPNSAELAYIRRADPICERFVKQVRTLGRHFNTTPPPTTDPVALTTEGLVRPGIPIIEREADALRGLQPRPDDANLANFIDLFEPLLELSQQRLKTSDSSKLAEAERLEQLIESLQQEQQAAASRFGFRVCGTSFVDALAGR